MNSFLKMLPNEYGSVVGFLYKMSLERIICLCLRGRSNSKWAKFPSYRPLQCVSGAASV